MKTSLMWIVINFASLDEKIRGTDLIKSYKYITGSVALVIKELQVNYWLNCIGNQTVTREILYTQTNTPTFFLTYGLRGRMLVNYN